MRRTHATESRTVRPRNRMRRAGRPRRPRRPRTSDESPRVGGAVDGLPRQRDPRGANREADPAAAGHRHRQPGHRGHGHRHQSHPRPRHLRHARRDRLRASASATTWSAATPRPASPRPTTCPLVTQNGHELNARGDPRARTRPSSSPTPRSARGTSSCSCATPASPSSSSTPERSLDNVDDARRSRSRPRSACRRRVTR